MAIALQLVASACDASGTKGGEAQGATREVAGTVCDVFSTSEMADVLGLDPRLEESSEEPGYCAWFDPEKVAPRVTIEVTDAHGFLRDVTPNTQEDALVEQLHGVNYEVDVRGSKAPPTAPKDLMDQVIERLEERGVVDEPVGDQDLRTSLALSLQRLLRWWDAIACDVGATPDEALRLVFDPDSSGFAEVFDRTVTAGCVETEVIGVEGPTSLSAQMEGGTVIARVATETDRDGISYWSARFVRSGQTWRLSAVTDEAGPLVAYCEPPAGFDLPVASGCSAL